MKYSYEGTDIYLDFYGYKNENISCTGWVKSKLYIKNKYMDIKIDDEFIETVELESLREFITEFLEGKIKKEEKIEFTEPDIEMHFFPKTKDNEMYMILIVDLFYEGGAAGQLRIKLNKKFIEELKKYIDDVCSLK